MDITFLGKDRVFKIDTENSSYVMGIVDDEGFLGHMYYGDKLDTTDASYLLKTIEPQYTPSVNMRDRSSFLDRFPFEYSSNNVGDYRKSSIEITDKNGHTGLLLCYESHNIIKGKKVIVN